MMTNLHPRSTPLSRRSDAKVGAPDHEDKGRASVPASLPTLGAALRAGQSEAIADALSVGRSVECRTPVPEPSPSEISNVKSQITRAPAGQSKILFALGISLVLVGCALAPSFSSLASVEGSETSAFSLGGSALAPSAFLSELPAPTASALGSWLISAVAALSILALGKQFMRKTPIEAEFLTKREFQEFKDKDFADLRNRIDHSHESLSNKLDGINNRLNDVGSLVARLDERTKVHRVHLPSTESTNS